MNIADIGYRLVQKKQAKYIGAEVAAVGLDLEPRENHFDKRITVTTPLQKAGAYLRHGQDGRRQHQQDRPLGRRHGDRPQAAQRQVASTSSADAVTGEPIAKANVEFFGYRQRHVDGNRYQIDTQNFAEATDADGQLIIARPKSTSAGLSMARHRHAPSDGRFAYLGFTNVWHGKYYDAEYNEVKMFAITDRPVYRPGQKVQFKFWIRHAQYDQDDKSDFAHQTFAVEIHNPKGEKVFTKTLHIRRLRRHRGEFELPADATLGQYTSSSSSTAAAARSASRNTRSPNTKSRSMRRPSR